MIYMVKMDDVFLNTAKVKNGRIGMMSFEVSACLQYTNFYYLPTFHPMM